MSNGKSYLEVGRIQSSSSGREYIIKEDDNGNLSCNCMAWRFQSKSQEARTCKHIKEFLEGDRISRGEEIISA